MPSCHPPSHPLLVLRRWRSGNPLTTGAFTVQRSLPVSSRGRTDNARVRATGGVVSTTFETMSYFALHKCAPLPEQWPVLVPSAFGILVLLLQEGPLLGLPGEFQPCSGGVLARWACAGHLFLTMPHPCLFLPPPSPNNLEYLLAMSKNLAHPLHPVSDNGKGGGLKWWV